MKNLRLEFLVVFFIFSVIFARNVFPADNDNTNSHPVVLFTSAEEGEFVKGIIGAYKAGKREEVIKTINDGMGRVRRTEGKLMTLAVSQLVLGKFTSAETTLYELTKIEPRNSEAYYFLGLISLARGFIKKATLLFNKAIEIDPKHEDALFAVVGINIDAGRFNEAFAFLKRVEEINPERADLLFAFGVYHVNKQEYSAAKKYLERAKDKNPNNADVHYYLGLVYEFNDEGKRLGTGADLKASLAGYGRAIEIKKDMADAYFNIGLVYKATGDISKAIEYTKEGLRLTPDYAVGYYNLGCYYALSGLLTESVENLNRAIDKGFKRYHIMKNDSDLLVLRGKKEFETLIEKLRMFK